MSSLALNPSYASWLASLGLTTPDAFLALEGIVISGHTDRNVSRVSINNSAPITGYLKREHRIPWKERIVNASQGFGFVSKSLREAMILQALADAGINCPQWMAFGEDRLGRAFLLTRALDNAVPLADHIRENSRRRRAIDELLGSTLRKIHDSGFEHGDLYAKHVLVSQSGDRTFILDWQRAQKRADLPWPRRIRDLASLAYTMPGDSGSGSSDLLRAYLADNSGTRRSPNRGSASQMLERWICYFAKRLGGRFPDGNGEGGPTQTVIWRDGEALCVTGSFNDKLTDAIPSWLRLGDMAVGPQRKLVALPDNERGILNYYVEPGILSWLRFKLQGKGTASRGIREAGLILRRERQGLSPPELLAFGQRLVGRWRLDSFVLVKEGSLRTCPKTRDCLKELS